MRKCNVTTKTSVKKWWEKYSPPDTDKGVKKKPTAWLFQPTRHYDVRSTIMAGPQVSYCI